MKHKVLLLIVAFLALAGFGNSAAGAKLDPPVCSLKWDVATNSYFLSIDAPQSYTGKAENLTVHYMEYYGTGTDSKYSQAKTAKGRYSRTRISADDSSLASFYGAYVSAPGFEESDVVYFKADNTDKYLIEVPYLTTTDGKRLETGSTINPGTKVMIFNPNYYPCKTDAGKFRTKIGPYEYSMYRHDIMSEKIPYITPADVETDEGTGNITFTVNGDFGATGDVFTVNFESSIIFGGGLENVFESMQYRSDDYTLSASRLPKPVVTWGWQTNGRDKKVMLKATLPSGVLLPEDLSASQVEVVHARFDSSLNAIGDETSRDLATMTSGFSWTESGDPLAKFPIYEVRLSAPGHPDSETVLAIFNGGKVKLPTPVVSVNGKPMSTGTDVQDVNIGSEISVNAETVLPAHGTFPAMVIGHSDIHFKVFENDVEKDECRDADFTVPDTYAGYTSRSEHYAVPDAKYASYFEKSDVSAPYNCRYVSQGKLSPIIMSSVGDNKIRIAVSSKAPEGFDIFFDRRPTFHQIRYDIENFTCGDYSADTPMAALCFNILNANTKDLYGGYHSTEGYEASDPVYCRYTEDNNDTSTPEKIPLRAPKIMVGDKYYDGKETLREGDKVTLINTNIFIADNDITPFKTRAGSIKAVFLGAKPTTLSEDPVSGDISFRITKEMVPAFQLSVQGVKVDNGGFGSHFMDAAETTYTIKAVEVLPNPVVEWKKGGSAGRVVLAISAEGGREDATVANVAYGRDFQPLGSDYSTRLLSEFKDGKIEWSYEGNPATTSPLYRVQLSKDGSVSSGEVLAVYNNVQMQFDGIVTVDGQPVADLKSIRVGQTIRYRKEVVLPAAGPFGTDIKVAGLEVTLPDHTPDNVKDADGYVSFTVPASAAEKSVDVKIDATLEPGMERYFKSSTTKTVNVEKTKLDAPRVTITSPDVINYSYVTVYVPENYKGAESDLVVHYIRYDVKNKSYKVGSTGYVHNNVWERVMSLDYGLILGTYVSAPGYEDSEIVYAKYAGVSFTLDAPYLEVNGERLADGSTVPAGAKVDIVTPNVYTGTGAGKFPTVLGGVKCEFTTSAPGDYSTDATTGNGSFTVKGNLGDKIGMKLTSESLVGDVIATSAEETCTLNIEKAAKLDVPTVSVSKWKERYSLGFKYYTEFLAQAPDNYVGEDNDLTIHVIEYNPALHSYKHESKTHEASIKYTQTSGYVNKIYGAYASAPGCEDSEIVYTKYKDDKFTLDVPSLEVDGEKLAADATVPADAKVDIVNNNVYTGKDDAGKFPTVLGEVTCDFTTMTPGDLSIDETSPYNGFFTVTEDLGSPIRFKLASKSLIGDVIASPADQEYTLAVDTEAGIEDVSVDENGVEAVYTLQGIRVTDTQNLRKGIYIVVKNGKAIKRIVR